MASTSLRPTEAQENHAPYRQPFFVQIHELIEDKTNVFGRRSWNQIRRHPWNTMPISMRTLSYSLSLRLVTSVPLILIEPLSGLINPTIFF